MSSESLGSPIARTPKSQTRLLLPVHTAKAEIFHLDILVDTVMGTFSSDPGYSFMPPNGATSLEINPVLMPTIPYSRSSATRQIRPMSRL